MKKNLNFLKCRKKEQKNKNVKNTSPLKEKEQCLLVFFFVCVDFLFFESKTPAHEKDFL